MRFYNVKYALFDEIYNIYIVPFVQNDKNYFFVRFLLHFVKIMV